MYNTPVCFNNNVDNAPAASSETFKDSPANASRKIDKMRKSNRSSPSRAMARTADCTTSSDRSRKVVITSTNELNICNTARSSAAPCNVESFSSSKSYEVGIYSPALYSLALR